MLTNVPRPTICSLSDKSPTSISSRISCPMWKPSVRCRKSYKRKLKRSQRSVDACTRLGKLYRFERGANIFRGRPLIKTSGSDTSSREVPKDSSVW